MIVCPVCEHQQEGGASCETCGKELVEVRLAPVATVPLEELEPTMFPAGNPNVAVELLPEIDEHHEREVAVQPDVMPDLDANAFPSTGAATPDPMPDLEITRLADDQTRTPLPAVPLCRYCGHPQPTGIVCDACGRALPRLVVDVPVVDNSLIICPACGVMGHSGRRCLACGSFVRTPELVPA